MCKVEHRVPVEIHASIAIEYLSGTWAHSPRAIIWCANRMIPQEIAPVPKLAFPTSSAKKRLKSSFCKSLSRKHYTYPVDYTPAMIEIRETERFAKWFSNLRDSRAKGRIDVRIRRLSLDNPGDVRSVGKGVSELRIDYGPGYRCVLRPPRAGDRHSPRRRRQTNPSPRSPGRPAARP